MTLHIPGVDCSDWQAPALPWPAWFAGGVHITWPRASVGFHVDAHFARYVTEAHAAGMVVGAYHAILGHQYYDPTKQAIDFLARLTPEVAFIVLDDEAPGVSTNDVVTWVRYVVAHCSLPLYLYGNWELAAHVAAAPELAQFGVIWAAYPEITNPTLTPPYDAPHNVPAGLRVVAWQYAGRTGRKPPYPGPLDLTDWYEWPNGTPPVVTPPADDRIPRALAQIEQMLTLLKGGL